MNSLLVLGGSTGTVGAGPLVSYLLEKLVAGLRMLFTIVPGGLTDEEIEAIT